MKNLFLILLMVEGSIEWLGSLVATQKPWLVDYVDNQDNAEWPDAGAGNQNIRFKLVLILKDNMLPNCKYKSVA